MGGPRFAFAISSDADAQAHASDISNAVSVVSSSFVMPCDGRRPPGADLVFNLWMDQGRQP